MVIPVPEYIGKAAVVIDIAERQRYPFADGIDFPGQADWSPRNLFIRTSQGRTALHIRLNLPGGVPFQHRLMRESRQIRYCLPRTPWDLNHSMPCKGTS